MPPRIAIGISHRPSVPRWGRRRRRRGFTPPTLPQAVVGAGRARSLSAPSPRATEFRYLARRPTQEHAVADNTLEDRGRALENQFFDQENKAKIAAMKEKLDAHQTREELRRASGMSDDSVLDKLVELGLRANTIAA